ncbi:MAG TPA: hypothetical protein VIM71_06385 [Lacunisphaera sp.]
MNFRILRDPGSEGGGGAAPGGAAGAQGGTGAAAGGQGAGQAAGQGSAAPEYLSKADFESFRNELTSHLSRLSRPEPSEGRSSGGDKGKQGDPKFPELADFDFKKPGEIQRYEDAKADYYEWRREQKSAERDREKSEKEAPQRAAREHAGRLKEYRKENPDFDADMSKAGGIHVLNEVQTAIYSSKNSPAIVHYLAKNKSEAQELNFIAESEGMDAVRERLGEIAATIRAEKQLAEANAKAAKDRPPRQSMRGPVADSKNNPSKEERYRRYQDA